MDSYSEVDKSARRVWSRGTYSVIAPDFLPMAAHLIQVTNVSEESTVLDVCCGTGNVAITAARRGASVTGLDIVPAMLENARKNAAIADTPDIRWQEGSASSLPFDANTFDITLSNVGHIFVNPPETTTSELFRVTRPEGQVAFTSWTPQSVVATMGKTLTNYLPENPNSPPPPFQWGDTDIVKRRLEGHCTTLECITDEITVPVLSPEHFWEKAITESGLFIEALEAVDTNKIPDLRDEMINVISNYFDSTRNMIPMKYLLTVARTPDTASSSSSE